MTAPWDIPTGPVDQAPAGYTPSTEQAEILRHALVTAGVELGTYDERILVWVAGWEWSTVAVITSWITRTRRATDDPWGYESRLCGCPEDYHLNDCRILRPEPDQSDPGDLADDMYRG